MADKGDRRNNGQFAPGWRGGPGRPKKDADTKAAEEAYYDILRGACSSDEFRAIASRLVLKAKRGDIQSIKLLLEYLIGSPEQYLNIAASLKLAGLDEMLALVYGGDADASDQHGNPG